MDCQLWTDCLVSPYSNMKFHQVNIQAFSPILMRIKSTDGVAVSGIILNCIKCGFTLPTETVRFSSSEENIICHVIMKSNEVHCSLYN